MTPRPTFTSRHTEPAKTGTGFALGGTRRDGTTTWREEFDTIAAEDVPPTVLEDLSSAMWVHDGQVIYGRSGILRFMETVIVPEHADRWAELMRDTDRRVDLEQIGDAMFHVVGELAGRPTGGRPSSPDGSSRTEGSSGDDSLSPDGATPETSTG